MGLEVGLEGRREVVPLPVIGRDPRVLGWYVCPMVYRSVIALFRKDVCDLRRVEGMRLLGDTEEGALNVQTNLST
jgi:hypothetical protein